METLSELMERLTGKYSLTPTQLAWVAFTNCPDLRLLDGGGIAALRRFAALPEEEQRAWVARTLGETQQ